MARMVIAPIASKVISQNLTITRTADQSEGNKTVGVDPTVITARRLPRITAQGWNANAYIADARKLAEKIKKKGGDALVAVKHNLVDAVWGDSRPPRPQEKIKTLPLEFSGKKFEEKLDDLRKELEKKKSAGLIVCGCQFRDSNHLLISGS